MRRAEYDDPRVVREGAWAIIRDRDGMTKAGHGAAVSWARGYVDSTRPAGVPVRLTDAELADVELVATEAEQRYRDRKVTSMRFRAPDHKRFVASFGAELAVARLTGRTWGRGDPRRADVGDDVEVRWSSERPPRLRLYDPDAPRSQDRGKLHRVFVLVSGWPPAYVVHGWRLGRELFERGERHVNPEGVASFYLPADELRRLPLP